MTTVPQVQITARDYYVITKGVPLGAAIALVSVLYHESKLRPASQGYQPTEHGGILNLHGAYGVASWNGPEDQTKIGDPRFDRQAALLAYAKQHGLDVSALDTQLSFVLTEIANRYPNVWAAIRSTASYQSIITILTDEYEIPANKAAEINDALAIARPLAALPPPQPTTPTPVPHVPATQVPTTVTPQPVAPAGLPPISSTIAGLDAAILDHYGLILDALTKQRDALNVRIAKIQAQAEDFSALEEVPTTQLSLSPVLPPTTPAEPAETTTQGTQNMPAIFTTILTNWATSALGGVAGGPSVIDVIQNPANWQHDLPGIATVLLGFVAKDGWVTGGTKQTPTPK